MRFKNIYKRIAVSALISTMVLPVLSVADTFAEEAVLADDVESANTPPLSSGADVLIQEDLTGNTDINIDEALSDDSDDLIKADNKETYVDAEPESTEEATGTPEAAEDATASDTSGVGAKKSDEKKTDNTDKDKKEEVREEYTGWKNENSSWYYYDSGKPYTGWHYMTAKEGEKIDHWSYFGKDGKLYTGWHYMTANEGEKTPHWSYFGTNGWLRTGWTELGEGTSNPDGNAKRHWSYFDKRGWLTTGWVHLGKGTPNPDGNAIAHWSYFDTRGWLTTGWAHLGKGTSNPDGNAEAHWSYFDTRGWLCTGWRELGKGTPNPDGDAQKHWSYFDNKGWLKTGWFQESSGIEGLRYFDNKGWLLGAYNYKTDWQKIGRVYYRFDGIGKISGANMPEYTVYDQIAYNFLGGCGPSAAFHAGIATGGLTSYGNTPYGYKRYIWDSYGMPYGTDDKNSKGVYTTATSIPGLSSFLKKNGTPASYLANRQYTTDEVKDCITHGQAIVPLMHVWYVGSKRSYWSQHYVVVTGWRQEGNSLQFYTGDSYKNVNTGWADVNKDGAKKSSYGYNKYTGYNSEVGRAPRPSSGTGYAMKVGSYINLP